ncbi:MAG: hypothetical protein M3487_08925, partial [Actinomycetota bacterium]|nr:hypothetical protein [Actinomycetota bacterium]
MPRTPGDVLIIGAGGHALVCIEVLRSAGARVAGCVSSDGLAGADLAPMGVDMAGTTDDVGRLVAAGTTELFVAVGDNDARRRLTAAACADGGRLVVAVSADAVVSPTAAIGDGALVMPGAVVNAQASIGAGAIVNTNATVEHECRVGDFVHLAPRSVLAGRVVVGDGALVGVGACVA